jgi:RsiW-degrading membrane proteinase PrsW (M82 family)
MILLALSIAPAVAIILYVLAKDKYNREPFKNLFLSFLLGALSTIPAVIIQLFLTSALNMVSGGSGILHYFLLAFFVVGVSEEGSKLFMLKRYAIQQPAFDEPLDGIIYGVMVAMGFATVENIMYVYQHGFQTAIARMFLAVPAHACFGILMGYFVGLAKFDHERMRSLINQGLGMAVFFHGCYDFFLFLEATSINRFLPAGFLTLGAIVSLYFAIRFSRRAIKLHQELSRIEYERRNSITEDFD